MALIRPEPEDHAKIRFQVELEFVQCLANPNYLNFLAQREYFKDSAFVNYLRYLQYWKEPEYAKFLKYPMCLYFLDLLQYPEFRKELANSRCAKFIEDQQLLHWQNYIRKRIKMSQTTAGTSTGPCSEMTMAQMMAAHSNVTFLASGGSQPAFLSMTGSGQLICPSTTIVTPNSNNSSSSNANSVK